MSSLWFLPERYKERQERLGPVLPANTEQGQGAEGKRKLGEEGKERRGGMSMGKQSREGSRHLFNSHSVPRVMLGLVPTFSAEERLLSGDFGLQVKEKPSQSIFSETELKRAQAKQTQKECMGSTAKAKAWLQEQLDSGTCVESPRSASRCPGFALSAWGDQDDGRSSLSLGLRSTGDEDLSTSSSVPA